MTSTEQIETTLTAEQEKAIREQAAVYDTDDCPNVVGLKSWRAYQWDDDPADFAAGSVLAKVEPYPPGAVAVDFSYIYDDGPGADEALGLETTVFATDGKVIDSQDFG